MNKLYKGYNFKFFKLDLALLLLIMLNFILKVIYINALPLEGDEPFTVFFSQGTLPELIDMIKTENNPPLHFLLLSFWVKIFGISPFSVRFLSYLFSCFTVIYIYKIGSKFFSHFVGFFSSLFFTFSSLNMLFSHEARVYSLFAFLTAGAFFYFLNCLKSKATNKYFIKLTLFNSLIIYAHFFGFIVLFIQVLTLIYLIIKNKIDIKNFIYSYSAVFILYLPYLIIFINRFLYSTSNGTWVSPPTDISALYFMLWSFCNAPFITVLLIVFLLMALFIYLFKQKNKVINFQTLLVLVWTFVPFIGMYILSFKVPMYLDRYLVFVSIGFYLIFALAIYKLRVLFNIKYVYILAFAVSLLFVISFEPKKEIDKRKANECALKIKEIKEKNPSTLVILSPDYTFRTFTYHYNRKYFIDYKNTITLLNNENIFPVNNINLIPNHILKLNNDIVFIDNWASLVDSKETIKSYIDSLKAIGKNVEDFKIGGTNITYLKH
jgi:hypothetical protein